MDLIIKWPDSFKAPHREFWSFAQKMANRILQGHIRYGVPKSSSCYLDRLKTELKAYERSGNSEHLYNIANYACLESQAPQNHKFHHNEYVGSATRKSDYGSGF